MNANDEILVAILDDAFGNCEDEEKYIRFNRIVGDEEQNFDSMRSLCLDFKCLWAKLERKSELKFKRN